MTFQPLTVARNLLQPAHVHSGNGAGFVHTLALPAQANTQLCGCRIDKIAHRKLTAGGDNKVIRLLLLQHKPLHFNVILGMTPVTFGIHIAQEQTILKAKHHTRHGAGDLAGHKGFTTDGRFVVKQNAVAGIHAVGFAVVNRNPVGVKLGAGVGRARIERRFFRLRHFLHQTKKL